MRYFFLVLLLGLFSLTLSSQADSWCGTEIDIHSLPYLETIDNRFHEEWKKSGYRATDLNMVPVKLWIIRTSAGTGGIDPVDFENALEFSNGHYRSANIFLYQCESIGYIDDDDYYDYDYSEMASLYFDHHVENVINIYSSENVYSGTTSICGHAQFPGGLDFIMLANSCTLNGSTMAHEIGHYFGLYHTHETFFGNELVNGSNCITAGDKLCDTPADPGLSGQVDNDCLYTGSETDSNGEVYTPDVSNAMSYSSKECRIFFSDDQFSKMVMVLLDDRSYLTCTSTQDLTAQFYSSFESICETEKEVEFQDVSLGDPNSWLWEFGDDNSSSDRSPTHSYLVPGNYNVSLTISDGTNNETLIREREVYVGYVQPPYSEDFENGYMGNTFQYASMKNNLLVSSDAANDGTYGLLMEGFFVSRSPYFRTPTSSTAFEDLKNPFYKTKVNFCVDASNMSSLSLSFDLKQNYAFNSNYTNFRILVDGSQIGSVYQPPSGGRDWEPIVVDLSTYDEQIFMLSFEGSHKYDQADNASMVDNLNILGVLLPVEFTRFEVRKMERESRIQWVVANEINHDHYEIQRADVGFNFSTIGMISDNKIQYSDSKTYLYYDKQPLDGVNYYRIKQVDKDGTESFTEIKSLFFEKKPKEIQVYPNPFYSEIYNNYTEGISEMKLINSTGQTVWRSISLIPERKITGLEFLQPGIYLFRITTINNLVQDQILVKME